MKLIAFAASSSRNSINAKLVRHACEQINFKAGKNVDVEVIDINDYAMPIYGIDHEEEFGIPQPAYDFFKKLGSADALLISFAEHNGSYTAAYKSLFDWASRIDSKVYQGKPMVMLATSPGSRGASTVLGLASNSATYFSGRVLATVSVPSFYDNFDVEKGALTNAELAQQLDTALAGLIELKN